MRDRSRITATGDRERWPITQRVKVFNCSCCPPNLTRFIPSIGDHFYAYDEEAKTVYVNQFGQSEFRCGGALVKQETCYPLDGSVKISSNVPVYVRIPGWTRGRFTADAACVVDNGYARFEAGAFTVKFEMAPVLVAANANVVNDIGKAVLMRGPIVYCAEGVDNGGDVHTLVFDRALLSEAETELQEQFPAPVITVPGLRLKASDELYAPLGEQYERVEIRLIPYSCFANRGETDLLVYLNVR